MPPRPAGGNGNIETRPLDGRDHEISNLHHTTMRRRALTRLEGPSKKPISGLHLLQLIALQQRRLSA
jgi:hypothetical protein